MSKQFNVVAQKIIDNTVQTALFVDDELIKPFENYKNSSGKEISEELYKAFSNHNCLLDFYRFSNIEEFRELKRDIFKGRDLLILDWQLISEEPKHFHTLEILNKAIDANNLPFVYIYTKTPEKDFEDIIINIKAYFSDINKEESVLLKEKVLKVIEEKGEDFNDIKNNNESVFKELILNDDSEQFKKLQTVFDEIECHNEINRIIKEDIKEKNLKEGFKKLGYIIFDYILSQNHIDNNYKVYIKSDQRLLFINQTIIIIGNKKVDPKDLYDRFKEAIIDISNNFLLFFGLEMRNLLRDSPIFLEENITEIDDIALFHHKDYDEISKSSFYNFLISIWQNQLSTNLLEYYNNLEIYKAFDNYKVLNDVEERITKSKDEANKYLKKELSKLNYQYNHLIIDKNSFSKLGFGDIFKLNKDGNDDTELYLLCITAHCDCMFPEEKIKNKFYFVQGYKISEDNALKQGDRGFLSFINYNNKIICIDWKDKPFTIYIPQERNDVNQEIFVKIDEEDYTLKYLATIKENYAQRIANNSFTYPLHVGIYFARITDE